MIVSTPAELEGLQKISDAVGITLKKMRDYIQPGMSALELDEYGGKVLAEMGAKSAPKLTYGFPGWTCICVNNEVAHGIPTASKIFRVGDLVNIDVSAELGGFWSDNGGSFVLGQDLHGHLPLVNASKNILQKALDTVVSGMRIAELGKLIETEARRSGYKVIKNLVGHGVGRSLHEEPKEIACYQDKFNTKRFKKNSVVAIETFISTKANYAYEQNDGWTYKTKDGSFVAQHEHTLMITDKKPVILTKSNGIWEF